MNYKSFVLSPKVVKSFILKFKLIVFPVRCLKKVQSFKFFHFQKLMVEGVRVTAATKLSMSLPI